MTALKLDTRRITDWDSFHDVFAEAFGFPGFYGRNMNAWIDCMSYLDDPGAGMSAVHVPAGEALALRLEHADDFAVRCPEQYRALVECAEFVNQRCIDAGQGPLLTLVFQ